MENSLSLTVYPPRVSEDVTSELKTRASLPQQELSHHLDNFNRLENSVDILIEGLPYETDDQVLHIKQYARSGGKAMWRLECAADAEIMKRVAQYRQRGKKCIDQEGATSEMERIAKAEGVTSRTIRRNAQIHNTFFVGDKVLDINVQNLEDKDFYVAALAADEPLKAIEQFSINKANNDFYSPSEAWKEIRKQKIEKFVQNTATPELALAEVVPHILGIGAARDVWMDFQRACTAMAAVIPIARTALEDCQEQISVLICRSDEKLKNRIFAVIEEAGGGLRLDKIAQAFDKPPQLMRTLLGVLVDDGELVDVEQGHAEGARGQRNTLYTLPSQARGFKRVSDEKPKPKRYDDDDDYDEEKEVYVTSIRS
ncbi:MAG TPA: hypothetical protein VEF04_20070 [Blastocatellia bacterium]|nr:hypothetical protein [Blastocatellia bacterium]